MGFAGFGAIDTETLFGEVLGERSAHIGKGIFGGVLGSIASRWGVR